VSLLAFIAEKRGIDPEDNKKNLGKAIADEVHGHGLKKLLEILPEKALEGFGIAKNEDSTKVKRAAMCKKIFAAMQEAGPAKYLEKLDTSSLASLFDDLELDKPSNPTNKKYAEALLKEADSIGVENTLSSLNITQLKVIADSLKIAVDSSSVNVLIDCIKDGQSYKKDKKEKVEPSKKKPEIKKGITKVDLQQHFYREELITYCKDNNLVTSGNKRQLIDRIINHFDGKALAGKKRKASPSKGRPAKKSKTEKGGKEDKKEDKKD